MYQIPSYVIKDVNKSSVSIVNGNVFINGYEFDKKKKKFKMSLKALFFGRESL